MQWQLLVRGCEESVQKPLTESVCARCNLLESDETFVVQRPFRTKLLGGY